MARVEMFDHVTKRFDIRLTPPPSEVGGHGLATIGARKPLPHLFRLGYPVQEGEGSGDSETFGSGGPDSSPAEHSTIDEPRDRISRGDATS